MRIGCCKSATYNLQLAEGTANLRQTILGRASVFVELHQKRDSVTV